MCFAWSLMFSLKNGTHLTNSARICKLMSSTVYIYIYRNSKSCCLTWALSLFWCYWQSHQSSKNCNYPPKGLATVTHAPIQMFFICYNNKRTLQSWQLWSWTQTMWSFSDTLWMKSKCVPVQFSFGRFTSFTSVFSAVLLWPDHSRFILVPSVSMPRGREAMITVM